ncbi:hypothetical protein [Streptomyces sp. 4F14]|uniref:hypothetical protein n=1 Tax=Streptomyces sp. 4F14 TaxID=3394380 RepID=UPI003A85DBC0
MGPPTEMDGLTCVYAHDGAASWLTTQAGGNAGLLSRTAAVAVLDPGLAATGPGPAPAVVSPRGVTTLTTGEGLTAFAAPVGGGDPPASGVLTLVTRNALGTGLGMHAVLTAAERISAALDGPADCSAPLDTRGALDELLRQGAPGSRGGAHA